MGSAQERNIVIVGGRGDWQGRHQHMPSVAHLVVNAG